MNRSRWMTLLPTAVLLASPVSVLAQDSDTTPKPLLQTKFTNNDASGWTTFGKSAKTKVVQDADRTGADKNVLQFDYNVAKDDLNVMFLSINENEIAQARSFRFSVKSDYPTTLAAVLQEKEGGRYTALFHVPGGKWQNVVLSPSEFILGKNDGDPADPDGKLDLDQVQFAGITDVGQIFAQAGDPNIAELFNVKAGAHSLWLGDFTIGQTPVPGTISASDPRLDAFTSPQVGWMTVGIVDVTNVSGKPLEGRGISAAYRQAPNRLAGIVRAVAPEKFNGKTGLHVSLASDKPAKIVLQLEEKGGGKYNTTLAVPGGNVATPFSVKFADLKAANDSKDDNGKLDLDKVFQVLLIDSSGLVDKADGPNTLYIGDLKAE